MEPRRLAALTKNTKLLASCAWWLLAAFVVTTAAIPIAAQSSSSEGFSVSYLDRSVDACTDFYQFACGKWLAANPVPADRARYSRLNELADRNARIVRDILENAAFTAVESTLTAIMARESMYKGREYKWSDVS